MRQRWRWRKQRETVSPTTQFPFCKSDIMKRVFFLFVSLLLICCCWSILCAFFPLRLTIFTWFGRVTSHLLYTIFHSSYDVFMHNNFSFLIWFRFMSSYCFYFVSLRYYRACVAFAYREFSRQIFD